MPRQKRYKPTGKAAGILAGVFAAAGLSWGGYQLFFKSDPEIQLTPLPDLGAEVSDDIIQTGKEQLTAAVYSESAGRTYRIWDGMIHEELNNNTGFNDFGTAFDHHLYDFDLGVVIHVPNGDQGGLSRTLFRDVIDQDHIERVREQGRLIAEHYIRQSKTDEYGQAPDDVMHFYNEHVSGHQNPPELESETVAEGTPDNLLTVSVSEDVLNAGDEQKTAGWHRWENGRKYFLWDGVIVEEFINNRDQQSYFWTSFDHHVYDFDLGVIIHVPNEDHGGLSRTLFRDANSEHIERIRNIGRQIAEGYISRSHTTDYKRAPDDVIAFYQRHWIDYLKSQGSVLSGEDVQSDEVLTIEAASNNFIGPVEPLTLDESVQPDERLKPPVPVIP